MFRIAGFILAIAALSGCSAHSKTMFEEQPAITANNLDGIYELVSETTELTKPRKTAISQPSQTTELYRQFF